MGTTSTRHKRILAVLLALALIFNGGLFVLPSEASAAPSYVYRPPEALYANGKEAAFFDYNMTLLGDNAYQALTTGAAQRNYLTARDMNLNSQGTWIVSGTTPYNMTGSTVFNGSLTVIDQEDEEKRAVADYNFNDLIRPYKATQNDNLYYARLKGDLSFTVSGSVYVRQYDNMLTGQDKSTAASVSFLGSSYQFDGKDTPNSWGKINMLGDGKSADGLLSFSDTGWGDYWGTLGWLSYYAKSRNGGPVDSKLRNFIVVGKDSQGPSVLAVDLQLSSGNTPPAKSNHPLTVDYGEPNPDWGGNVTKIRQEDIGKTLFISLMFDEPVKFKDEWATEQNLSNLGLQLRTIGKDGTSAQLAEAKFHSYAPGQYDDCPIMTFAYTIQDPQTDVRKDLYYTFTDLVISDAENSNIFNKLVDLSGNAFNMKNGNQTNQTLSLRSTTNGERTTVDLEDLTVDNVVLRPASWVVTDGFMRPGSYMDAELHLNKLLPESTTSNPANLPTLKMNFSDTTLTATVSESPPSSSLMPYTILTYHAYVGDGDTTPGSDPVKISSIVIPNGCVDAAGYKLTCSLETVTYDKALYVDTVKPTLGLTLTEIDSGAAGGLYLAELTITDDHPGMSAQFRLSHDAEASGTAKYSVGSSASDYDISRMTEASGTSVSVTAPAVNGKSYAFFLLPDGIDYISKVSAWADTTDLAGNRSDSISVDVTPAVVDNVKPIAFFTAAQATATGFSTKITMGDRSAYEYEYIWVEGTDTSQAPDLAATWIPGKSSDGTTLIETLEFPLTAQPGETYEYVLWVKVTDVHHNEAVFAQPFVYYKSDFTLDVIEVTGIDYDNPEKIFYLKDGVNPSVTVDPGSSVTYIDYTWSGSFSTVHKTAYNINPEENYTISLLSDLTAEQIKSIAGPVTLSLKTNGNNNPISITFNVLYEPESAGRFFNSQFAALNRYGAEDRRSLTGDPTKGNLLKNADSESNAINGFSLHNMAEMEIQFKPNASAGFDTVKDVTVTLKQIEFTDEDGIMSWESGASRFDDTEKSESTVFTQKLTPGDFFPAAGGNYAATVRITDLSQIEQVPCRVDADGNFTKLVRYELWAETTYNGTAHSTDTMLNTFVFYDAEISDIRISDIAVNNGGGVSKDYTPPQLHKAALSGSGTVSGHSVAVPRVTLRRASQSTFKPLFMVYDLPKIALDMIAYSCNGSNSNSESFQMLYTGGIDAVKYNEELRLYYIDPDAGGKETAVSYPDANNNVFPDVYFTGASPQRLYYQIADVRTEEKAIFYSPIYCVDIVTDDIPPEITFVQSVTAPTAGAVTVKYTVADGHTGEGGVFVSDTPADRIALDVTAVYTDGTSGSPELDPQSNTYTFRGNGTLTIEAADLAGNTVTRDIEVTNIDNTPPNVEDAGWTMDRSSGMFHISATVSGGGKTAALRFDETYTKSRLLSEEEAADFDWAGMNGDISHPDWPSFPIGPAVNGRMGELNGIHISDVTMSGGEITRIELDGYVNYHKAYNPGLQELALAVCDEFGNERVISRTARSCLSVSDYLYPVSIGRIGEFNYSPGGTIYFSVPVRLQIDGVDGPEANGEYRREFSNLRVYKSGEFNVTYIDIFGVPSDIDNIYTAEMGEYAHRLTVTPEGKTKGDVTVTVDTTESSGSVKEGTNGVYSVVMTDNGNVTYTIAAPGGTEQEFTVSVTNIDRTAPAASVMREVNGTETFDGAGNAAVNGSVTYTIMGFDEPNVTMKDGAPFSHTFNAAGSHTFYFTDEAGNEGSLTVTETADITFVGDTAIAKIRASYTVNGGSPVELGEFNPNDTITVQLASPTNKNIVVNLTAYNSEGHEISSALSSVGSVDGVGVSAQAVTFTKDAQVSVIVTSGVSDATVTVEVVNSIDTTPPTGTVRYVLLTQDEYYGDGGVFSKGGFKMYIEPDDPTEIVMIEYTDDQSAVMTIHTDAGGKFIYYAQNGSGHFSLYDKAGNVGTVVVGVYDADTTPPGISSESWFGAQGAEGRDTVLGTPTNSVVRIVLRFDEILAGVDIEAYAAHYNTVPQPSKLEPLSDYIRYTLSGNMLTLEFRQNCQARITVSDIKGNSTTILRPEDGPVTVIDRTPPTYTETNRDTTGNEVKITYTFSEPVRSANSGSELLAVHTITYTKNGVYPMTFADNVGNVVTFVETVTQIDNATPTLKYLVRAAAGGTLGVDYIEDNNGKLVATKGNLELLLYTYDASDVTLTVTNRTALSLSTVSETVSGTAFTQKAVITENGNYDIRAEDEWGNAVVQRVKVDIIDREAPVISLASSRTVNMKIGDTAAALEDALKDGVTASDAREGDVTNDIIIDYGGTNADTIIAAPGQYTVQYKVSDSLGNAAVPRSRTIRVSSGENVQIGGETVWSGDIFITTAGELTVTAAAKYKLYAERGLLTYGEMKYAPPLTSGKLNASEPGYYTLLAQGSDREICLVYVFVY